MLMSSVISGIFWGSLIAVFAFLFQGQTLYALVSLCLALIVGVLFRRR